MLNLTLMQVGAALLWALFALLPLFLALCLKTTDDETGQMFCGMLSMALQLFFGVACYIAGHGG